MAILKNGVTSVLCGLGTYTHTAANNGMYYASARSTVNPTSGLILTLAQTGSTSVSVNSPAPSDSQTNIVLSTWFNCAIGDVITITLASSTAIDNQLNTVKSILDIHYGQSQG